MKNHQNYLTLLLILLLSLSCGSEKKQEVKPKAFIDLYARFIYPQKSFFAEASMKTGDSLDNAVLTDFPEGIHANGTLMDRKELATGKTKYRYQSETENFNQVEFRYKDIEDKSRSTVLKLDTISNFTVNKDDVLNKSAENSLKWVGDPLDEQESYVLVFTHEGGKSFVASVNGPTEDSNGKIPAHSYANIDPGNAELYIVKKIASRSDEGCNIVFGLTETYSHSKGISIRE